MDSSPIMLRTASQGSDRTRSGESVESPVTAPTLYTPETQRYNGRLVRTFGSLTSDASSPAAGSAFDMSKLTASLRASSSGLSATANSFTPASIFKSSKLARLTAVSTPDVITPATHAAPQPSASSPFATPLATSDSDMSKIKDAPLGRPTRYVVVFANKPEHVKVLATITDTLFDGITKASIDHFQGAIVLRFDDIRDAEKAVSDARVNMNSAGKHPLAEFGRSVCFISGYQFAAFDTSPDFDPDEGKILLTAFHAPVTSANLTPTQLRNITYKEAAHFGDIFEWTPVFEGDRFVIFAEYYSLKDTKKILDQYRTACPGKKYPDAIFSAKRYSAASAFEPTIDIKRENFKAREGITMNYLTPFHDRGAEPSTSNQLTGMRDFGLSSPVSFDMPTSSNRRDSLRAPDFMVNQQAVPFHNPLPRAPPGLHTPIGIDMMDSFPKPPRSNRNSNPVDIGRIMRGEDIRTTVMLRNIPNKMNVHELKAIIDKTSFGHYDFSYLRIDFQNLCNVGYAFINFTKPEYIMDFLVEHQGKPWNMYNSDKIAEVSYATRQGLASLIDLFQNSCVMEEWPDHRPKLWYTEADGPHLCGKEKPFPKPTNYQKLQRSRDMASTVGLYPPRGARGFHHDERHRVSQYDRGTPQALLDAHRNMLQSGLAYHPLASGVGGALSYSYAYPPASPVNAFSPFY